MNKDNQIIETKDSVYFFQGIFSNFYRRTFKYKGKFFFCSEQAFMYDKALTFVDPVSTEAILQARSPYMCKQLGRRVRNFDEDVWNKKKEQLMFDILVAKFNSHHDLKTALINTGDKMIYEASPYDKEWGIGISVSDAANGQSKNGLNKLGQTLVKVREHLKSI